MKNLSLRLLTVATLALISATACKKDKDSDESGKLSATINGTAYKPTSVAAIDYSGYITIAGLQIASGDSLVLSLDIPDTAHVNNPIDVYSGGITYTKTKNDITYTAIGNNSHGSTTLTSWDKTNKKIAGNFNGVIYVLGSSSDSIVVANGQFNTTYQ